MYKQTKKKPRKTGFLCIWKSRADVCIDLDAWDDIHRSINAILVVMRQLEEIIQRRLRGVKVGLF